MKSVRRGVSRLSNVSSNIDGSNESNQQNVSFIFARAD
jgi:hypothetical protein